jgi:hypothetical protein
LWHVAHRGTSHDLIVFPVVIVDRREATQADIGCSLEVGVLHARGDRDLLGIGIIDYVNPSRGCRRSAAKLLTKDEARRFTGTGRSEPPAGVL